MSSQLSPICQKIANKIKGFEKQKAIFSEQLKHAATPMKADIAREIKEQNAQIGKLKRELADCIKKNPFVPPSEPPKPKPNPCKPQDVAKLEAALEKQIQNAVAPFQKLLQKASTGEKADLNLQIKEIRSDIRKNSKAAKDLAAKRKEYIQCLIDNDGFPAALDAIFKGKATMDTMSESRTLHFKKNVAIGLTFSDWDRLDIRITSFPDIPETFDTHSPVGEVTTTVSGVGTGKFDRFSNTITFDLHLFFHHATDFASDDNLDITLETTSPLTPAGKITVKGSSNFKKGGFLGDEDTFASLTVIGTISPHPLSK
jgi:hypothetical protein